MILADKIRQYVRDEIIATARQQVLSMVKIRAGDIHSSLECRIGCQQFVLRWIPRSF